MNRPIQLCFSDNMRRLLCLLSLTPKEPYVDRLTEDTTELLKLVGIEENSDEYVETLSDLKGTRVMYIDNDRARRMILLDQIIRFRKSTVQTIINLKRNRYFKQALQDWVSTGNGDYA